jgi:hypothetical protein
MWRISLGDRASRGFPLTATGPIFPSPPWGRGWPIGRVRGHSLRREAADIFRRTRNNNRRGAPGGTTPSPAPAGAPSPEPTPGPFLVKEGRFQAPSPEGGGAGNSRSTAPRLRNGSPVQRRPCWVGEGLAGEGKASASPGVFPSTFNCTQGRIAPFVSWHEKSTLSPCR